MQKRSLIVLILGLVVALGTAWSLHSRMNRDSASTSASTQVITAAVDISAGSFIRADQSLALSDWPAKNITPSMLTTDTAKPADFEGAVARRSIGKGEPITANMLVKSNEGGFMSAVLEPGKRAVSIAVDSTTGNAGFIFPGDRVDLILTHSVDMRGTVERASETFLEDVRVLAVDQMLDNPENKAVLAKTVTLEVTPKQAESINVAKDLGAISLSLRSLAHQVDEPATEEVPTDLNALLESASGEPAEPAPTHITRDTDVSKAITPSEGKRVRVLRGDQVEEIDFNAPPSGGSDAR